MGLVYFPAYTCDGAGCEQTAGDPKDIDNPSDALDVAKKLGWSLGVIRGKDLCPKCYAKALGISGDNDPEPKR